MLLALYVAVAEQQGVAAGQAARHAAERHAQGVHRAEGVDLRRPRAACGSSATCSSTARATMPLWNTISISGYHIREAGATAVQELAFTLADGIGYVAARASRPASTSTSSRRGCRSSGTSTTTSSRRSPSSARRAACGRGIMRERFGAKNPRSWLLRTHAQTAGVSLMAQQPLNNVVRTTMQALAAVLGGTQSLHTNSLRRDLRAADRGGGDARAAHAAGHRRGDRAWPTVADPLGGSYFVETLTDQMEEAARGLHREDRRDGRHRARRRGGLPAARDRRAAYRVPAAGRHAASAPIVGVNKYVTGERGRQDPDAQDRPRGRALADGAHQEAQGGARPRGGGARPRRGQARRGGRRQPGHGRARRDQEGRHHRRGVGRVPPGVGRAPRSCLSLTTRQAHSTASAKKRQ